MRQEIIRAAAILVTGTLVACGGAHKSTQEIKAEDCTRKVMRIPDGASASIKLENTPDGFQVKVDTQKSTLPKILPSEKTAAATWRVYSFKKGENWLKQPGDGNAHLTEVNFKDLKPEATREGRDVWKCLRDNQLVPGS